MNWGVSAACEWQQLSLRIKLLPHHSVTKMGKIKSFEKLWPQPASSRCPTGPYFHCPRNTSLVLTEFENILNNPGWKRPRFENNFCFIFQLCPYNLVQFVCSIMSCSHSFKLKTPWFLWIAGALSFATWCGLSRCSQQGICRDDQAMFISHGNHPHLDHHQSLKGHTRYYFSDSHQKGAKYWNDFTCC